jgi:hypothetical protein
MWQDEEEARGEAEPLETSTPVDSPVIPASTRRKKAKPPVTMSPPSPPRPAVSVRQAAAAPQTPNKPVMASAASTPKSGISTVAPSRPSGGEKGSASRKQPVATIIPVHPGSPPKRKVAFASPQQAAFTKKVSGVPVDEGRDTGMLQLLTTNHTHTFRLQMRAKPPPPPLFASPSSPDDLLNLFDDFSEFDGGKSKDKSKSRMKSSREILAGKKNTGKGAAAARGTSEAPRGANKDYEMAVNFSFDSDM